MTELQRDSPLFDKILVIRLQSGIQEARQIPLTVRIIPGIRPTSIHGQNEKLFHFEVTDENDPYFLYVLDVGEQDFHHLKRDQSLLVEFPVFPSKMIELIELCLNLNSSSNNHTNSCGSQQASSSSSMLNVSEYSSSTFTANLEMTSGVFTIVESNKFKQLTHITLQLRPGNDAAIKGYLSSRLSFITTVANKRKIELESTHTELNEEKSQRALLSKDITELRALRDTEVRMVRTTHMEEVARLRMDQLSALEAERTRNEIQNSALQQSLDNTQQDFQKSRECNEQQITELTFDKNQLDYRVRELTSQITAIQADRVRLSEEAAAAICSRKQLDEEKSSLEKGLARLEARYEASLQQLTDREETMSKTAALLKAGEEAKASLEEKLAIYAENLDYLQGKLESEGFKVSKGNKAVKDLRVEKNELNEKIKLKNDVIRNQDTIVTDLRAKSVEMGHEMTRERDALRALQLQCEQQSRQIEEAHNRLEESSKVISNNQEVITYLNEEINKWQLGLSDTVSTPGYQKYSKYDNKYDNKYESKFDFSHDMKYENKYAGTYGGNTDRKYDTLEYKFDGSKSNSEQRQGQGQGQGQGQSSSHTDILHQRENRGASNTHHSPDHSSIPTRHSSINVISFSPETPGHVPQNPILVGPKSQAKDNSDIDDLLFIDMKVKNNNSAFSKNDYRNTKNNNNNNTRENDVEKESGRDILLRGIQNLGLGASFGSLEGLGLDISIANDNSDKFLSTFPEKENRNSGIPVGPRTVGRDLGSGSGGRMIQNNTSKRGGDGDRDRDPGKGRSGGRAGVGVDIESLAYYATGARSSRLHSQ